MEEKTQAEYRKEVYQYLRDEGFDLTPERHKKLVDLIAPIKDREVQITSNIPREHHVICKQCGGRRLFHGKKPHWKTQYNKAEFPKENQPIKE